VTLGKDFSKTCFEEDVCSPGPRPRPRFVSGGRGKAGVRGQGSGIWLRAKVSGPYPRYQALQRVLLQVQVSRLGSRLTKKRYGGGGGFYPAHPSNSAAIFRERLPMAPERRKRTRVKFNFETTVTVDNREVKVQSHNLSLKGMLCSSDSIFQEDQVCRVTLNLTPQSEGDPSRPPPWPHHPHQSYRNRH